MSMSASTEKTLEELIAYLEKKASLGEETVVFRTRPLLLLLKRIQKSLSGKREECRDPGGTGADGEDVFHCSECGCILSLYDMNGVNNLCTSFIFDYPRFCPECGRKIVANGRGNSEQSY